MKRYIYLLSVFHERIHEILGHEYPGNQGDWLPCSRENPLSTLCILLVSNFPGILPAKTLPCSVCFGNQGDRLPCSLKFSTSMGFKKRFDLFGIYVIDLFGFFFFFLLLIRSDLFGIYVIDLFGFLLLIRSDLFGIYVMSKI